LGHKSKFLRDQSRHDSKERERQAQQIKKAQGQSKDRFSEHVTIGMIEPHLQALYRETKKASNGLEQVMQMYEDLTRAIVSAGLVTQEQLDKVIVQAREERVRKDAEAREIIEKQKLEIRARAVDVHREIVEGKISFEDAAKKYSDCPSKDKGGDLDWITTATVTQEFANFVWALEMNKISEPFWTRHGFHIAQVLGEESGRRHVRHILFSVAGGNVVPILPEKA
jgi:parvulin-like peptidyl-prolyl isomerase